MDAIKVGFQSDRDTQMDYDNQLVVFFDHIGGVELLEELQKHPNSKVSSLVEEFEVFFEDED